VTELRPAPAILGRGVVIADGEPPHGWQAAAVVVLDDAVLADPAEAVGRLHQAWATRTPVVVRLSVDPGRFRAPRSVTAEPWSLPADFEIWEDRLQFLVWANNYDARSGEAVWWWSRKACRLGAAPAPPGTPGDVVLPDGCPAWIDGGPRTVWDGGRVAGAAVVAAESVDLGRLPLRRGAAGAPSGAGGDLAPDQQAAVLHACGPARIVAPAGSGKTRVLTERIRHLVLDRGWEPAGIVAVAFNKRAQEELDARLSGVGVRTRTLNSLGLSILATGAGRTPGLLDERDVRRIVERHAPARRHRANTDPIGPYLEGLSAIRLGLRDPVEVEASREDVPGLAELWPRFREELAERGAVDFDEQIYGALGALLGDGKLRARMQRQCRHMLVDEFQDLTPAHLLLVRLLAAPEFDCFGVGDDDQVIYGHAGADPSFLIDYARLFPAAASHPLEINYRCPPEVVDAAVRLLSHNRRRVAKTIRSARADRAEGALRVERHRAGSGLSRLVAVVQAWLADGAAPASVAVLARVNATTLGPVIALGDAGVPVAAVLRPELLDRTGIRAALAYLRIALADEGQIDPRDVAEILRRPSRGLPPWFVDRLRRRRGWSGPDLAELAVAVPARDAAKVERLADDVIALRAAAGSLDAAGLLRLVRVEGGLGGAMALLDARRGGESASHLDDLEALEAVAALHPDAASFESWLRSWMGRPPVEGGVTVSTVHRVKGMEWDRVAVFAVNAGLFPHRLAGDVEEERRVLHVALTRGRHEVAVLAERARPSPMLEELAVAAPGPPVVTGGSEPPGSRRAGADEDRDGSPASTTRRIGRRGARSDVPARPAPVVAAGSADVALEEALRAWRRERAGADGVPAYVVFADRTLRAIVSSRPATLAALAEVEGIGPAKLDRYGEAILAVVASADSDTVER
jgi:DNA helicase-2/ATP-dependent DNA helicase PcrA